MPHKPWTEGPDPKPWFCTACFDRFASQWGTKAPHTLIFKPRPEKKNS